MPLPLLAFLGLGAAGELAYGKYKQSRGEQQAKKYGQVFSDIIGTPGQELAGPRREGYQGPLMSPGTGLLGGELSIPEAAGQIAQIPGYQDLAGSVFETAIEPPSAKSPKTLTMGVPGKPDMRTNAILGPQGELIPIGEPWKQGAATQINIGEGGKGVAPLVPEPERLSRNWPEGTAYDTKTGKPIFPPAAQAKEVSQEERASGILDRYEDMLFNPETGIYSDQFSLDKQTKALLPDWAESTIEKGGAIAENMWDYFSQQDPRVRTYEDFRAGTTSMLAKSFGEAGALAEGDIQRAMALQPQIYGLKPDSPEVAKNKISNLRKLINKGQENARLGITVRIDENGQRWEHKIDPKTGKEFKRQVKDEDYGL